MRNAAAHASKLQTYGDVLALQKMQLSSIQDEISDGNARLYDQLEDLKNHRNTSKESQILQEPQTHVTRSSNPRYVGSRNRSSIRFRLPIMSWLAGRTWEIAVGQSQASWTLQIHPINFRPRESLAFRYVREGNITAVDRLLRAGELSIWDVTTTGFDRQTTLLGVRVDPAVKLCVFDAAD
jgi:hypothetical protein